MKRKWWIILALAALIAALGVGADAESGGQCGENVFWSLSSDGKTLTILGTGAMADYASRTRCPGMANARRSPRRWWARA